MQDPITNKFNSSPKADTVEAEQALKDWGIAYQKKPDGSLLVPGNLDISGKKLTTLPNLCSVSVGGGFHCYSNNLASLEYAPRSFKNIVSDFGKFTSWEEVPEHLAPVTKARLKQEREKAFSDSTTILQAPIKISSPLRLKK